MDLRQFFEGFFRLNEELNSFFEQSTFRGDGDLFQEREHAFQERPEPKQSPRDMMLKKRPVRGVDHHHQLQPASPEHRPGDGHSLIDLLGSGENFFRSSQFENTFSGDLSGTGMFEEKIVIRNGDGTEKVITKHSAGGRTTTREVTRRGGQILAESEVVSDIGDDFAKIGSGPFSGGGDGKPEGFNFEDGVPRCPKTPDDSSGSSSRSWSLWNWFK